MLNNFTQNHRDRKLNGGFQGAVLGRVGSYYLTCIEFQFEMMKKFWRWW